MPHLGRLLVTEQQALPLTIQEFLETRWSEEEAAAKACTVAWPTTADKIYDEVYRVALPTHDDQDTDEWDVRIRREEARHIVDWSPSHILADIAAKRAVLADYLKAVEDSRLSGNPTVWGQQARFGLWIAVQHLAEPYRDHPGWRADW